MSSTERGSVSNLKARTLTSSADNTAFLLLIQFIRKSDRTRMQGHPQVKLIVKNESINKMKVFSEKTDDYKM